MNKILILDTETTDKGADARLIQLAYKNLVTGGISHGLFKPPTLITNEAMSVHHITNEKVRGYPPFEKSGAKDELIKLIADGFIIVAHNAPFDVQILKNEGIEVPQFIDTYKVAASSIIGPDNYKLQYLRYYLNLYQREVGTQWSQVQAHDAIGDVMVLEQLWNYLTLDLAMSTSQMLHISSRPLLLRKLPFGKHQGKPFATIYAIDRNYLAWLRRQGNLTPDLVHTLDYYLHPNQQIESATQA